MSFKQRRDLVKQSSTDSEEPELDSSQSSLARTMAKINATGKSHEEMTNEALNELDEMKQNMNNSAAAKKRQYLLGAQEPPR